MTRLALLGIAAALVCGCPSAHEIVRSCGEAVLAPEGTRCEGFGDCSVCGHLIRCQGGELINQPALCDAGVSEDAAFGDVGAADAGSDAGIDAGPCAPRDPPSGAGCHTDAECDSTTFQMCYAPGTGPGCPLCVHAMHLCASDADCPPEAYCESYIDPCSHPGFCGNGSDVTSTRCSPRCTASSCAAGEQCETDGRCTPIPCVGGYVCPAHTVCHDLAGGDAHGCVRDSCGLDSDCGCGGACLGGSCYDTLGTCMTPAA
jgi:hypothetical protein